VRYARYLWGGFLEVVYQTHVKIQSEGTIEGCSTGFGVCRLGRSIVILIRGGFVDASKG
jgi:hypothetical protein